MNEQQIKQIIGQLDSSIDKIEDYLSESEFQDYCDSTYSAIAHWRVVLKSIKKQPETEEK